MGHRESLAVILHLQGHALSGLLQPDAHAFRAVIEGHCDERGSAEYNLALGARRAARAADLLAEFGWPKNQSQTISYGKEAPQCTESTEACWQRNRRAHLTVRR